MSRRFEKGYGSRGVLVERNVGIFFDWGVTVPADNTAGFAPGCIFIDQDASGNVSWYRNDGTLAACDFNQITGGVDLSGLTATATELNTIGTGVLATGAEVNRTSDVSTRLVTLAVSTAITEALHEGRTILMTGAGSARTFTLPAATGSGGRYRFVVGEVNTSNYIINSVVGTDLMKGQIIGCDGGGVTAPLIWAAGATDDSVLLNGTTTGGVSIGDWVEFEDISATAWAVRGMIQQSGSEATPFRDAVA